MDVEGIPNGYSKNPGVGFLNLCRGVKNYLVLTYSNYMIFKNQCHGIGDGVVFFRGANRLDSG